jgi:hypothetical protein
MNDIERYLFDLNGFLVIEDMLSEAEVSELNGHLDDYDLWHAQNSDPRFSEVWEYGDNYRIVGPSHVWDGAFRRAISHPNLLPYLREIVGPTVRYDHGQVILMHQGAGKLGLHGGGTPWDPSQYYHWHAGTMHTGLIVVSLALCDMSPEDGGFVCLPGSHKSNLPCPDAFLSFAQTSPTLFRATLKAGSAVIFSEALTHGTYPWSGSHERRALLMKYCPGHMAYQNNYPVPDDATDETFEVVEEALFNPPYIVDNTDEQRPQLASSTLATDQP